MHAIKHKDDVDLSGYAFSLFPHHVFEKHRRSSFIIGADQTICKIHAGWMDRVPGQHPQGVA